MQDIVKKITPIFKKYQVKKAALFGSQARGEAKKNSDVDILVELGTKLDLLDYIGLKQELEHRLNKQVDLVQFSKIKPALKPYILKDCQVIYAQ